MTTHGASASKPAVAVLGAGSWGTALAIHLARTGHRAAIWGRDPAQLDAMTRDRSNARYLPGVAFPDGLTVVATLDAAIAQADDVLVVVPSHAFREMPRPVSGRCCVRACVSRGPPKGFELDTGRLPNEVATEVLGHPSTDGRAVRAHVRA
jgi:glycerol-3-phosphate dehydrogenase (NAD(P)+)